MARDDMGRIIQRIFADTLTPNIVNIYDNNGNKLSTSRGSTSWSYAYNDINLLESEQLSVDGYLFNIDYNFNSAGALEEMTLPSGRIIHFTPDGLGRPRTAQESSLFYANNIQYHENGMIKQFVYGNGHAYSQILNDSQLPQRILSVKNSIKPLDLTYHYDKRKLVTQIEDASPSNHDLTLGYDGLEQLVSANGFWGSGEFKYDSLGNVRYKRLGGRNITVSYNTKYQVSSSVDVGNLGGNTGTRSFNHDNRGNVTQSGNISFTYDYADQPISISGAKQGSYVYDGNLKRVKSTVEGKTIYNVYDMSGKLVHIFDVTNNKRTDYIKAGTINVARVENNTPTYLHADMLGSPVAGTNSNGDITFTEKYTPFGISLINDAANDNQAGFTGHIKDTDTGLVYMQARYYDPVIGRFYSNDPVGALGHSNIAHGFNRYAYANNNPYKYTDPTGEIPLVVVAIWILKEVGGEVFEQTTGIPAPTVKNAAKYGMKKAMKQSIKNRKKIEGVYKFKEGDQEYVGQSKDVMKRIKQHASNKDKFAKDKAGTLETKEVKGGKLEREKTEQGMIDDATGGRGAASDKVSNKVNPCRREECS